MKLRSSAISTGSIRAGGDVSVNPPHRQPERARPGKSDAGAGETPAGHLTEAEAREIANETIAFWRNQGMGAREAWSALGRPPLFDVRWRQVRTYMVRWQLSHYRDAAVPSRRAA